MRRRSGRWGAGADAERPAISAAPEYVDEQAAGQHVRHAPEDGGRPGRRVLPIRGDRRAGYRGSRGQADGDAPAGDIDRGGELTVPAEFDLKPATGANPQGPFEPFEQPGGTHAELLAL